MALGDYTLFQWKSKETREREQKEYAVWAFPHGQEQRDNLEALMRELSPKGQTSFMLMGFLTCKELYERYLKKTESSEQAVDILINKEQSYKNIIKKNEMTTCIALVLADAEVGENCKYPSVEDIRERIKTLDGLKRKKKG